MWNNGLAGISLRGTESFYANKLNLGTEDRNNEHSGVRRRYLFCCPSKAPNLVTGIGRWIYARDERGLVINQLVGSTLKTDFDGEPLQVELSTDLPWEGRTKLTICEASTKPMAVRVRIPGWVRSDRPIPSDPYRYADGPAPKLSVKLNGESATSAGSDDGYFELNRVWKAGDILELNMTMPVRRVRTDDTVVANRGRVALMRGPLLYCLEGIDNPFDVRDMEVRPDDAITSTFRRELLGGIQTLDGAGTLGDGTRVSWRAVPYFAWENRGIGTLATLIVEDRKQAGSDRRSGPTTTNIDG